MTQFDLDVVRVDLDEALLRGQDVADTLVEEGEVRDKEDVRSKVCQLGVVLRDEEHRGVRRGIGDVR